MNEYLLTFATTYILAALIVGGLLIWDTNGAALVKSEATTLLEKAKKENLTTEEAQSIKDVARKETESYREDVKATLKAKARAGTISHEELKTWLALEGSKTIKDFKGSPDDLFKEILK